MTPPSAEEQVRRDALRWAYFRKILHTYGVGAGAGSVALFVTQQEPSLWPLAGVCLALATHFLCLYLAPYGVEADD